MFTIETAVSNLVYINYSALSDMYVFYEPFMCSSMSFDDSTIHYTDSYFKFAIQTTSCKFSSRFSASVSRSTTPMDPNFFSATGK